MASVWLCKCRYLLTLCHPTHSFCDPNFKKQISIFTAPFLCTYIDVTAPPPHCDLLLPSYWNSAPLTLDCLLTVDLIKQVFTENRNHSIFLIIVIVIAWPLYCRHLVYHPFCIQSMLKIIQSNPRGNSSYSPLCIPSLSFLTPSDIRISIHHHMLHSSSSHCPDVQHNTLFRNVSRCQIRRTGMTQSSRTDRCSFEGYWM